MADRDGNGWVRCRLGHRHWGRFGAAGMLLFVPAADGAQTQLLLQQRAWWSHHGGTWGLPGGARDSHESAIAAALREAAEECAIRPDAVTVRGSYCDDHGGWAYDTVLAQAAAPVSVHPASDETIATAWTFVPDVSSLDLHPGFAAHWPELRDTLRPATVIVDGANVMGSRPDGWWRDRAGAALRLRDGLAGLAQSGVAGSAVAGSGVAGSDVAGSDVAGLQGGPARPGQLSLQRWFPDFVLVVEGAARPAAGAPPPAVSVAAAGLGRPDGRLRVVAAPGSGDDTLAELAAGLTGWRLVVTADRELRARCTTAGAAVVGPRWLLDLL